MRNHILLIDDDKDEIVVLCEMMQQSGLQNSCTWAQGVEHALQILTYLTPDIIMIDYNMPAINGVEGLKKIKQLENIAAVPVIIYSNSIDDVREAAIAEGAAACVKKPTILADFKIMFKLLQSIIQNKQTESAHSL